MNIYLVYTSCYYKQKIVHINESSEIFRDKRARCRRRGTKHDGYVSLAGIVIFSNGASAYYES